MSSPLWGENNDVTITGYGNSELDDTLAELAKKYNRYIMPDPDAYNGMFYRSDHFPFVQKRHPGHVRQRLERQPQTG